MSQKILIVEDDALIREELAVLLEHAGYQVLVITDFYKVADQVRALSPDLILMDINLPDTDGYRLCTQLRRTLQTPVLFLTGRSSAMDELQALTMGGDDYVTKPFSAPVLLARISLLLKRRSGTEDVCRTWKGVTLNPVAATLRAGQADLELTKTELKIMHMLFCHPGEIVSRMDLTEYLWDNEIHIDDNTLSVNIMRIREKLQTLGIGDFIVTKRGMGYKI